MMVKSIDKFCQDFQAVKGEIAMHITDDYLAAILKTSKIPADEESFHKRDKERAKLHLLRIRMLCGN